MLRCDFFFTLPSRLGRRLSMIDPLGLRAAATHYLHRLAPGFTGRVRGRTWFPVLCWAAMIVEDDEVQSRTALDEEPRVRVRARRSAMASLERAMRMGAVLEGRIDDHPRWRYGNRPVWFDRHRRPRIKTNHGAGEPPFFASRGSELANNALGCLRRSLERHALMVPSEGRLAAAHVDVTPTDRYRLTDRGRRLAEAFERDLVRNGIERGVLKEWGLFPDRLGRELGSDPKREAALRKISRVIPVTPQGMFDRERFSSAWSMMTELFQVDADPLFGGHATSGPVPAVVRAFRLAPAEAHPLDALSSATASPDNWDERRLAALRAAAVLMGRSTPDRRSLFEVLGSCFVHGMRAAFPNQALDSLHFSDQFGPRAFGIAPGDFERGRSDYLAAVEALATLEHRSDLELAPRVERDTSWGIEYFNKWVQDTPSLDLESLVRLHESLPRFTGGRVMPLVERDAGGAFLEAMFPWSKVEPTARTAAQNESDITDIQDALAAGDDEELDEEAEELETEEEAGRALVTDYWWAATIAGDVILGRSR